jgi:hypothetical protein
MHPRLPKNWAVVTVFWDIFSRGPSPPAAMG